MSVYTYNKLKSEDKVALESIKEAIENKYPEKALENINPRFEDGNLIVDYLWGKDLGEMIAEASKNSSELIQWLSQTESLTPWVSIYYKGEYKHEVRIVSEESAVYDMFEQLGVHDDLNYEEDLDALFESAEMQKKFRFISEARENGTLSDAEYSIIADAIQEGAVRKIEVSE